MHTFSVWAPIAKAVDVVVGGRRHAMNRAEGGWWIAEVAEAEPGAEYCLSVDGNDPLPDPRSPWQPAGVHGPSKLVDHSAFQWTDSKWQARPLRSAIIYEIHVGTFTPGGTFLSAIERLDHLVDLGITHLELMPVNEFSGAWGWGYDGVDLFAPHHHYGAPDDLKRLVNAAHERGLAVLLDVMYNHLGPSGNYLSRFGPYFTARHITPWGEAVNLDGAWSYEVRRFFRDNAILWLRDYHFDGLRLDAIHALIDSGATHLVEQLACDVEKLSIELGRHLCLIAESDLNDPRVVRPREMGGYGIDAQWSDDFHHALHCVITGENTGYYEDFGSIANLAKALKDVFVYDGAFSSYRKRPHGRPIGPLPGSQFLGYIQNHDQIGNRPAGERITQLVNLRQAKIAAGVVIASPFIPMLFQGEEWAASSPFQYFTQHEDHALAVAVSSGRRNEFVAFGWNPDHVPDPQGACTFQRSKLGWEELSEGEHAEMLDWYTRLIALRRSNRWLGDGNLALVHVDYNEEARWLTFRRGPLIVACNFAGTSQIVPAPGVARILLASSSDVQLASDAARLSPESFAIFAPENI